MVDLPRIVGQRPAGVRIRVAHQVVRRAFGDDAAALVAAFRPQVHDPVGGADHVQVVLDDQQRMAGGQQLAEGPHQAGDVVEVQAGGGLVEQQQAALQRPLGRPRARGLGQVAGQLQALGLAARQGRHGLAQAHVFQAHVGQGRQAPLHVAQALEEVQRLAHGHVQDLVDRGAAAQVLDAHFQDLGAEAVAVAVRAAQVHVRQELHFHVLEAGAAAAGAAAVAGVEAEGAGRVAALLRQRGGGEQLADGVEGADVAGGVGARRLADGRLVHHHHVGDALRAQQGGVFAGRLGGAAQPLQQGGVEHVLHQGGLARPGHAGQAHQPAQRQGKVDALQIVGAGALQQQARGAFLHRQGARRLDAHPAAEVAAGQRVGRGQLGRRAVEDDVPAALARPGADVEDAVGGDHDLRIVLHHDQGVAVVAQPVHDLDDAVDVARVQADGRLVQHEQRVHQGRAQRGGQVDALDLAAREGAALPVQRQVAQADVAQEAQAGADFVQQLGQGVVQRTAQFDAVEPVAHPLDGQAHEVVQAQAGQGRQLLRRPARVRRQEAGRAGDRVAGLPQAPQRGVGLEPRALAMRARRVAAVLGQQHAHVHLVGARFQPVEEALRAVPLVLPGGRPALPVGRAADHPAALLVRQVAPGHVQAHARPGGVAFHLDLAFLVAGGLPGLDRSAAQAAGLVRHDQAVVDAHHPAEAPAMLAGAQRGIEGEGAGQRRAVVDVAVRAVQTGAEAPFLLALVEQGVDAEPAVALAQGRFQGFVHARRFRVAEAEAVLHDVQHAPAGIAGLALAGRFPGGLGRGSRIVLAVDARVALLFQEAAHLVLGEVGGHRHGEGDHQAGISGGAQAVQLVPDAGGVVARHRPGAAAAMQVAGAGVEQLQVVVELRHRAHGAARIAHRVDLVDGDGGQDAFDAVDLGLVHAVQELARVGRERLDVAALAFGVQGVEGQRALAGSGHAGHHQELPGADRQIQVLQVVLAGAEDADGCVHPAIIIRRAASLRCVEQGHVPGPAPGPAEAARLDPRQRFGRGAGPSAPPESYNRLNVAGPIPAPRGKPEKSP
ncbi:hypothetical protein CDEN61S_01756 [Castellaniella denitrificans]